MLQTLLQVAQAAPSDWLLEFVNAHAGWGQVLVSVAVLMFWWGATQEEYRDA